MRFAEFELDDTKAESNYKKHGVRFSEVATVWLADSAFEMLDPDHREKRWIRLGMSRTARVLVVVYIEKIDGERVRIISARMATRSESEQYNSR